MAVGQIFLNNPKNFWAGGRTGDNMFGVMAKST